jgi:hypothetical protein
MHCEEDADDCASDPCYAAGTSSCFDLGNSLYECKCNENFAGDHCEISDVNTYIFSIVVSGSEDPESFAVQVEQDLASQYPNLHVSVILSEVDDSSANTYFGITFWSDDQDPVNPPTPEDIQDSLTASGYDAVVVYADETEQPSGAVVTRPMLLAYIFVIGISVFRAAL